MTYLVYLGLAAGYALIVARLRPSRLRSAAEIAVPFVVALGLRAAAAVLPEFCPS